MSDVTGATVPASSTDGPLTDDVVEPTVTSSDVVFAGKVWDIKRDTFEYDGSSITREYMAHTGAVAILAIDDSDRVLVIKQYRHPIRSRDWELPAGLLDVEGEDKLTAAKRELAEEADLEASTWSQLVSFHTTPGGSDEEVTVFVATGVSATSEPFDRSEEEADIEVRWVPLGDVVEGVLAGGLKNSILSIAALAAAASR